MKLLILGAALLAVFFMLCALFGIAMIIKTCEFLDSNR